MAQHQTCDRQLSEPMIDQFTWLTHVRPFPCDQLGITTLPRLSECTTYLRSGRLPSGRLITCKAILGHVFCYCFFITHQSYKRQIQQNNIRRHTAHGLILNNGLSQESCVFVQSMICVNKWVNHGLKVDYTPCYRWLRWITTKKSKPRDFLESLVK